MARPRKALWESPDKQIYITQHRRGFLVVDTRDGRTERLRSSLDEALKTARASSTGTPREVTFFELALDYLANGTTVWNDTQGSVALCIDTIEDRKARLRNHYADVGSLPISQLPPHFIGDSVKRLRTQGRSKSLQDKVRTEALAVMQWGASLGLVSSTHDWVGPLRKVKKKQVDSSKVIGRNVRQLPSHRTVHELARMAARESNAPHMKLFFWMLAYMGFREGELCAVTIGDVEVGKRLRIHVRRKAIWRSGHGTIVEDYAKGYTQRTVVVPRILEAAVLARTKEVRAANGTLLFPSWTPSYRTEQVIDYSALRALFLRCGEQVGWKVLTRSRSRSYTGSDGRTRNYPGKAQSLEYTIHDLRAFAASTMYEPRHGMSLRGMGMSIHAVARQLGDSPETVKRHYLGIVDGNAAILEREVP